MKVIALPTQHWLISYYYIKVCVFRRCEEACNGSEDWRRSTRLLSSSKIMSFIEASSWSAAPAAIEHCGRIPKRSKLRELDVMELRCNPFLLDLLWELGTLSLSLSERERERERHTHTHTQRERKGVKILCEACNRESWERNYCNEFLLHESFQLIYILERERGKPCCDLFLLLESLKLIFLRERERSDTDRGMLHSISSSWELQHYFSLLTEIENWGTEIEKEKCAATNPFFMRDWKWSWERENK